MLPIYLMAEILKIGDEVKIIKLKSQHDREYTLKENGVWIITWDKLTTRSANQYFRDNNISNETNLIVDVSQAPYGIFNLFILPDMQRYSHPILLSYDEIYNRTLPYKEEHLTLLKIENKIITNISFIKNKEEIGEFLLK